MPDTNSAFSDWAAQAGDRTYKDAATQQLARLLWRTYCTLCAEGFDDEQAMRLTETMMVEGFKINRPLPPSS